MEPALRDGRLCLSSVIELAKVITAENATEVLPRFFGLSSRDAAFVAASIRPVEDPPRREVVTSPRSPATVAARHDPAPQPSEEAPARLAFRAPEMPPAEASAPAGPPPRPRPATAKIDVEPLDSELVRLHLTAPRRLLAKLEAARDALSHACPGAGTVDVLEAALDLVLSQHAKRKGLVEKPRKTPPPSGADHVPAHVRRAVWKRAGGRCEFPLDSGGVCGSTHQLEFDHIQPRALGGPSTVENVRVLCKAHNLHAARLVFGDAWMDLFAKRKLAGAVSEIKAPRDPAAGTRPPAP